jgi:YesN/AraC family two-component response regulator
MLRLKVFLVDDHPIYLEGLKTILKDESALQLVGTASDGLSAYDYITAHEPDISIIDLGRLRHFIS